MSATISCLCGGIICTISGTDKGPVLCHCANCKKVTGSAFAHNRRFMKARFDYVRGEDLVKAYEDSNTKTGNTLRRHFCANCGSCLFIKSSAVEGLAVVHCGVVEGEESHKPKFELFEEDRRQWMSKI